MTKAELRDIVAALKENDKALHCLFKNREKLVANLTPEEKDYVHRKLYSDGESHYSI